MNELVEARARSFIQFPLRISERRVLLTTLDLLAVNGALFAALIFRSDHAFAKFQASVHSVWFFVISVIWLGMAHTFDAYEPRITTRLGASLRAVLKAGVITSLIYLLIPYITPPLPTSRLGLLTLPLLMIGALLAERYLYALILPSPVFQHRVLIIGAGRAGCTIARVLAAGDETGPRMVGFIDDDVDKLNTIVTIPRVRESGRPETPGAIHLPVLGGRDTIRDLIHRHRVSTLILAITHKVDSGLLQTLLSCIEQGVEVLPMPEMYERLTGRVPVEHVRENWYVEIPVEGRGASTFWRAGKRLMDIALAIFGLLCLAVVLPFIAAAIYLDSRGPVFYVQERVGKGGRIFRAYKFRSMVRDAENGTAVWARRNDPRTTRVGRLLRATHLDEFPQFFNVLKGEMSAVGPRPERPEFVDRLAAEIPFYRLRHIVKPGMGGWGLVRQGYAGSEEDALVRLQYDLYYIKHQSLSLDVVILLKTIAHALMLRGR